MRNAAPKRFAYDGSNPARADGDLGQTMRFA